MALPPGSPNVVSMTRPCVVRSAQVGANSHSEPARRIGDAAEKFLQQACRRRDIGPRRHVDCRDTLPRRGLREQYRAFVIPVPLAPASASAAPTPLIVFSHLRWQFVCRRPQHLMTHLSRRWRVLFVEEPVRDAGDARLESTTLNPNLELLVPHTPVDAPGFDDAQLPLLAPLLDALRRERGIDRPIAWFYTPMALPLLARLQPRAVVYDCIDELAVLEDAPRTLREREQALLGIADLVLTSGPSLYEAKRHRHPNVHCLPSAVDAARFAPEQLDAASDAAQQAAALHAGVAHPRLGFFGVIDKRIDLALVDALAAARPDWQIVMVGPIAASVAGRLPARPNIRWLGSQPYELLPHLMNGWDLCLMPFVLDATTRYLSPTKTLEYIAGEKPVVSTAVPDVVALYGDLVQIAHGPREFVDACAALLAETPWQRSRRIARLVATVFRSSWAHNAEYVHRLLVQALDVAPEAPAAARRTGAPADPVEAG
jgi:UDP-galactopyranose mutase